METSTSKLTIGKLIRGLPKLRGHEDRMDLYTKENNFKPKYSIVDKTAFVGIEVEVEGVQTVRVTPSYHWLMKEDGSLRNYGKEFVSYPLQAYRIEAALHELQNALYLQEIDFSERTSVHVHLNVRTFTLKQIEAFILTYLLFEKVLFSYVKPERYTNIFCTPIVETNYGYKIKQAISRQIPTFNWSKYTALNLLPIVDKGTIEFRHLHGTIDTEVILNWINIILCIKKYAFKNSPDLIKEKIFNLNSTSQYIDMGNEVFGPYLKHLICPNYQKMVEDCNSYIKTQCFINPFEDRISVVEPESPLGIKYKLHKNKEDRVTEVIRNTLEEVRHHENFNQLLNGTQPTVRPSMTRFSLRLDANEIAVNIPPITDFNF